MHSSAQCYDGRVKILARAAAILGGLVLAFILLCGAVICARGGHPMPRPDLPADPGSRFRVAVLGDAQKGLQNFANLLALAKRERPALYLHTGDLVSTNDEGHYRLAALYLRRAGLEAPLHVVPGNHDVKGGRERFERELGPAERSFRTGPLFVVTVDNSSGRPPDLARLEARLSEAPPGTAVLLAMHVPPFNLKGEVQPGYEPFLEWLARSPARYLLSGHIHGYLRREVGRTVVIANGVGGDYDTWNHRQDAVLTILDVDGDRVTDRAIVIPPEIGVVENLEHFAIGHVAQAYRARPFWCWTGTALLASLVVSAFRYARRRTPGPRAGEPAGPDPAGPPLARG